MDNNVNMEPVVVLLICLLHITFGNNCSFPSAYQHNWTTTSDLGDLVITASTLTSDKPYGNSGEILFNCIYTKNSNTYVLQSNHTEAGFGGPVHVWMCIELHLTGDSVGYFHLHSEKESFFNDARLKGFLASATVNISVVCEITNDEFHSMLLQGATSSDLTAQTVPTSLMGVFTYIYHDSSGTINCSANTTATVSACQAQNRTHVQVNSTGCSATPFSSSTSGLLSNIGAFRDNNTGEYFVQLYNTDTGASSPLFCTVVYSNNSTVYLSVSPTNCESGQTATTIPTGGFRLELFAIRVPPTEETSTNLIWLIPLLVFLAVIIIATIVLALLHIHCKNAEKKKAREKNILITDDHPLGEMSITLDAPTTMEGDIPYVDARNEFYKSPRSKKKVEMMNPMSETSLNLDFKRRTWASLSSRDHTSGYDTDPFTEMDNGTVMAISQRGSKTARSARSKSHKQNFFTEIKTPYGDMRSPVKGMNGDVNRPLAITAGKPQTPGSALETRTLRSEISFYRTPSSRSLKAPSERAISVKAPSVKAPSVRAPSVKAPSVKAAPSVRAITARNAQTPGAQSYRTTSVKSKVTRKDPLPKFRRSVTSTKIGSVSMNARRGAPAPASPRKRKIVRSKTMVVHSGTTNDDETQGGVENFLEGEATWGATSDAGMSLSARTNRSTRTNKSRATTIGSPRKSILKKISQYTSSTQYLTEEELSRYNDADLAPLASSANHSLQEEYDEMVRSNDPLSSIRKVAATKKPWH